MSYQPNFRDPRVQTRARQALGFACGTMSADKPNAWSTRYIDKWFGQQQNKLSKYLREQLLIVTKDKFNKDTGECKEYILNSAGVEHISASLGISNNTTYPTVLQVTQSAFASELQSGEFAYNDQSQRLWHPLQNFRREVKRDVLNSAGYQFHYDVECCAMTLIHQYSQQLPDPMDLYLEHVVAYLKDRKTIREQIAQAAEIPEQLVKRIINALLAGAQLSKNPTTQIYQMLEGDIARIEFLKQHEFLTQLRAEIKIMWDYIKPTMPRRSRTQANGRERMIPISSRQKWGVYFDLERQVLNEVRAFLCERDIKHFLEHDGWSCDQEIDQLELQQRIHENTGFQVEFDLK